MKRLGLTWVLGFMLHISLIGQDSISVNDYGWLRMLADSLLNAPELCTDCLSPPEIRSYTTPTGLLRFRLWYKCDATSSTAKIYSENGEVVAFCIFDDNEDTCGFPLEFTAYTFGRNITKIWSCDGGFICASSHR